MMNWRGLSEAEPVADPDAARVAAVNTETHRFYRTNSDFEGEVDKGSICAYTYGGYNVAENKAS